MSKGRLIVITSYFMFAVELTSGFELLAAWFSLVVFKTFSARREFEYLTYGQGHHHEVTDTCNQLTIFGHQ